LRDVELLRVVAGLLLALDGKPQTEVDITDLGASDTTIVRANDKGTS
jgi:transcription-repair coupling factor (superfamily II helicase)